VPKQDLRRQTVLHPLAFLTHPDRPNDDLPDMRLLQFTSRGEFGLVEFADDQLPPYAILSHTWRDDGNEITFNDLQTGRAMTKDAYKKLKFCGDQAVLDGLSYFWIDTCCIQKSNIVELQHAINSMFRFYGGASKCYVYLSDVSSSQPSWKSAFRTSRWFTRSWTLQELLAPEVVEFFSEEGDKLGDKKALKKEIHEITRIPVEALEGNSMSQFTVDERMSWAKDRKAKYQEDLAYSLQGIFDICIPTLYGEGKERAISRLREEIEKRITGE
jgi:hypothetical protein